MEGNSEIRKYEETIRRLFQQLKTVCEERDEARHQIQVLLRESQPSITISTKEYSEMSSNSKSPIAPRSYDLDLSMARRQSRDCRTQTNKVAVADVGPSSTDIMIERMVWGKPLPQKGRLLRTVTEAGPLLHTLLVAPLPQWQNPPPLDDDRVASDNPDPDAVIPTSLSLAFPGNCPPYSRMSSALIVDVDSDKMNNNILTGKKRKLL